MQINKWLIFVHFVLFFFLQANDSSYNFKRFEIFQVLKNKNVKNNPYINPTAQVLAPLSQSLVALKRAVFFF